MNDKNNEKSFDILVDVNQLLNNVPPSIYQGKTSAWRKFFQAWARRTMEQDYLETLVNHRLNTCAFLVLESNPLSKKGNTDEELDMFLKGVAYGVKMLYGDIKKAGVNEQIKSKEDKE